MLSLPVRDLLTESSTAEVKMSKMSHSKSASTFYDSLILHVPTFMEMHQVGFV